MDINNLIAVFEHRLRTQRYSESSINNYSSAVKSFLKMASKKYSNPKELTAKEVEKYIVWLIEKKSISSSYQRVLVASIDKFYKLVMNTNINIGMLSAVK